jgi:CheY-like chemotaxis protein
MSDGTSIDTRAPRMLVVDDDAFILRLTERFARSLGFEVVALLRAEEAIALVRGGAAFDVLVTDVNMPGMDGLTLALEIEDLGIALPVLFMSGGVGLHALPAGSALLVKPFRRDDLAGALATIGIVAPRTRP